MEAVNKHRTMTHRQVKAKAIPTQKLWSSQKKLVRLASTRIDYAATNALTASESSAYSTLPYILLK